MVLLKMKLQSRKRKPGKTKIIYLNNAVREAIELYLSTLKDYNMDDFYLQATNANLMKQHRHIYNSLLG